MKRREFLKKSAFASIPIIGAGLSTSCETVNNSESDGNWSSDFEIMTEAARFEAATIRTYQEAAETIFVSDVSTPDEVKQTATLYSGHHSEHLALFNQNFEGHDGFPPVLINDEQPDSRLDSLTTYTEVLQLALQMEFEAAQFYFSRMNDQLTTRKVRKIFADVLPMEVGHMVSYKMVLGQSPALDEGLFQNFGTGL
ncbi:MAG: hypothetical protein D8M58_20520 [Calditrichaeota bacterium]|nr:MAG: hypothetical protein DWQ03_00850 [Calditrichota bacterium]MBL1207795.1 hypothetical protein [Calditrichota bacterium]NOG47629.1 hypothetical protein [Calditrichota bacterium]